MFADELHALSARHPGYRLTVRPTRTEGRLDLSRLDDLVPDWRDRQTWACGPEGLLIEAEHAWAAAGIGDRLHLERFAAVRGAVQGAGGAVTFARSGVTRTADAATSLLDAGEQAGVRMPFGCRMGICHTCMVSLVDGRVVDLRNGTEHEPGSRVQVCVTAPSGDCVVDI
jgi:ferredoxin